MIERDKSRLWRLYKSGKSPETRDILVESYKDLVSYIVNKYHHICQSNGMILTADDIKQIAIVGLLDAIERYDPSRGFKFETYALSRIQGTIQDELRKYDWMSRSERKNYNLKETDDAKTDSNKSASGHYIKNNKMSVDDIADDSVNLFETLNDDELKKSLVKIIQGLGERERIIITLYYYEDLTMKDIGKILSLSESRVSQIHSEVLELIRRELSVLKSNE